MIKNWIVVGDPTSSGGAVITGSPSLRSMAYPSRG